jgi:hypothetical protein
MNDLLSASIVQTTQPIVYQILPADSLLEVSIRHLVERLSTLDTQEGIQLTESLKQLPQRLREGLKQAFINEHLVTFNRLLNDKLTTYSMPTYGDDQQSVQAYTGAAVLDGAGFMVVGSQTLEDSDESGTFLHLWLYKDFFDLEIPNRKPRSSKTIKFIDTSPHAPHQGKSVYYPCTRIQPCRNSSRFLLYVPHEIQVWSIDDSYELIYETTIRTSAGQAITANVHTLSLSPDGSYLALLQNSPSSQELLLSLTKPTDSQVTSPLHCNPLPSEYKGIAVWSSCGTYLVSIAVGESPQRIIVWTIQNGVTIPVRSYTYHYSETLKPITFCVSSQARFLIVRSGRLGYANEAEIIELIELLENCNAPEPLKHTPLHIYKSSLNSIYDRIELSHDERYCLISSSNKGCMLVDLRKKSSLAIPSKGWGPTFLNNGHISKGNRFILNITVSVAELISPFEPFCHLSCTELFLLNKISGELEKKEAETIELKKLYKKLNDTLISKPGAAVLLSQLQILLKDTIPGECGSS